MAEKYMNPREAIIVLNKLNTVERVRGDPDEIRAAIITAREALRKQIPEPPNIKYYSLNVYDVLCPNCDAVFQVWEKYCSNCGKLLDWSK